ncbi:MAG: aminodeoxychorismate/anthranilate synthase component II [Candidatus Nephthysia bennettiae]|uniref:Aminodeoxychorismate/anthranilate synthase component II n=1 Tax=Candidatus Nephthysia bennettiae TaxID=3127016 RepID=A0A934JXY8_9BACT|nr:aminodeoxychorismate/anthranilate synthase component II [Candidatus Dormibacteraeota bacterium]MBJ7611717.1 aminodeoxychorismate/anthranilate synthase component II [Candidatus Dormibacteraeota bacterium]PZR96713.1 MAG: aminodeoxychorismate/anthranilate synthase component II [Candidatus Dormibacteraeota bacterium]
MRIAVLDNYDSFTYNLVQYLAELGAYPEVFRNDAVTVEELQGYEALVISPGPGTPTEAGISVEAIRRLSGKMPVLGVCLGHQALAEAFGGRVVRHQPVHGKTSLVRHDGRQPYAGLADPFPAGRYHSLVVEPDSLPSELEVSSWTDDGVVMGLRHRSHPTFGVQFHPESVLTVDGKRLLTNFLAS